MAFRTLRLFNRFTKNVCTLRLNYVSSLTIPTEKQSIKRKECKTEDNFIYLEDPDTFGTLDRSIITQKDEFEDAGDIKEHEFLQNLPLSSKKLTIKQYSDIIKQYLKHKRLKEAIDVLEVRMLTQDRVKPENYIYNILIGACADVGYTKKAFKLFNDMKRRALKPTGDTYTCLFHACANSPMPEDGVKNAHHLRNLMIEKGVKPNLTNYNAMVKAFGRCGDLLTAFKIVDEMKANKIKIRVHTFNHLLHACISDKSHGLRHALLVWRKMLQSREKPNIYSFNLMLKCVKECNLGSRQDIEELVSDIQAQMLLGCRQNVEVLQIEQPKQDQLTDKTNAEEGFINQLNCDAKQTLDASALEQKSGAYKDDTVVILTNSNAAEKDLSDPSDNNLNESNNPDNISLELINKNVPKVKENTRTVPNLLSKVINLNQVISLQPVRSPQEKFAIVGGQEDFLKEMAENSVKPDIKTFTQMLPLLENSTEAENLLLEAMKAQDVKADIDFYNMLIKKRCLRSDYDAAFKVPELINQESEVRKKRFPHSKKLQLKADIITYGVLAMACKTKESAELLLNEMNEQQMKVNIEILGTLLRQGTAHNRFDYVTYIMKIVKQENIKVNDIFIKHLEAFDNKWSNLIKQKQNDPSKCPDSFVKSYLRFANYYKIWLKEVNAEEALKPEHPWAQFKDNNPETVQRSNIEIKEPKKFYKRNRKHVKYTPL